MTYRVFPSMAVAGWMAALAALAQAQSPAEFYKGKNVDLYIGYSVGGGYDLYARVLARHIGRHIPGNPTVVVKNMEGAGSLRLANWLYRVAPKDGSVFGIISRGTGFDPLLGADGGAVRRHQVHLDRQRQPRGQRVRRVWRPRRRHQIRRSSDQGDDGRRHRRQRRHRPVSQGRQRRARHQDEGRERLSGRQRRRARDGARRGAGPLRLVVVEREGDPRSWIAEKRLNVLVQLALQKHPDLPDVPLITDLAKTDEQRRSCG